MTSFSGKNICVRRDGQRPIDSVKPTESGCPSGYKACSSQTANWWDIVCIPDSFDAATSCPVTAVNFVPISQISSYGSEWTKVAFTSTTAIVYTQTASSNGPVGSTLVGIQPCLDPAEITNYPEYHYPLEIEQGWDQCTIDIPDFPANDPRYRQLDTSYKVSIYDL